ncbi:MAG: GtrA family protein [Chitinophagaceae bacterium]|nr:GtrA family protein [Chitinophagaceae bacterium]
MRHHFFRIRDVILPVIDFFYPVFRAVLPLQTFRYLACGGANTLLGLAAYYVSYRYVFKETTFDFGLYALKGHVAALMVSFAITFPVGFFLAKYVVFSDSNLRGRIQLYRYFLICLFNLSLNYIILKILVEKMHIYPLTAQVITILIVILFSYVAQRNFSFRLIENEDKTG